MSERPLVSAVTIVRNGERFLEEAIRSVLTQTYEVLELVVVDDGSTDSSAAIASRFVAEQPHRVHLVRHEGGANRGMSASRNLGVRRSRGPLVAFLDADDVWLPTKTAEQVPILLRHPEAALVYGRMQIWHSWRSDAPEPDAFDQLGVEPDRLYGPRELLPGLVRNASQTPGTCNAMFRREAYERVGGFEDSFRGAYEDQVFFSKLYVHFSTFVAGRCWARYRQHPGNSEGRFSYARYYRRRREFLEWLAGYLARTAPESARVVCEELRRARHPYRAALTARLAKLTR